ncbi:hypothetical protein ACJMK2_032472 [Sinanodonta woodiana]|uniref:Proteasome maturation protein n=1 Tax=Sinanodonta woodiana TaxID=1069815 RepID=A0ABD3X3B5_SINWO
MSFPSVRPEPQGTVPIDLPEGPYGVPDKFLHGFQNARNGTMQVHPLEYSERHWEENKRKMDFMMLRNTQGLHAPLRLQMESFIVNKPQRLPGLHSSNILYDSLTGRDQLLTFEDVLSNPADSEVMGQPHAMMEKQLNIL